MNLIKSTIGKNAIVSLTVFAFILALNLCNIDTPAISLESEHSHGDSHSESTAHSHGDEEDSSCCSDIQAIIAIPQKILLLTQLKNSSSFLYRFLFTANSNPSQFFLVWTPVNDAGPPDSLLSEFVFLVNHFSHAPPAIYSI